MEVDHRRVEGASIEDGGASGQSEVAYLCRDLRDLQMQLELERREYSSDIMSLKRQLSESESNRRDANNYIVMLKEDISRLHDAYVGLEAEYRQFRSRTDQGLVVSVPVDTYERTLMEREDVYSKLMKLELADRVAEETEASLKEQNYIILKQLAMHESIAEKSFTQLHQELEQARSESFAYAAEVSKVKELLSVQEDLNRRLLADQASHMKQYEATSSQTAEILRLLDENERLRDRVALDVDLVKAAEINASKVVELRQHNIACEELHRAAIEHLQSELDEARRSRAQGMHRISKEKHQMQNDLKSKIQDLDQLRQCLNQNIAEKLRLEEQWRSEAAQLKRDRSALEQELESRLKELAQVRKERDQIHTEADSLNVALVNMEMAIQVREQQAEERVDKEKRNLESIVAAKAQYCRALENEKQDLIIETAVLMKRISALELDLASARIDADEARRKLVDCEADNAMLQSRVVGASLPLNTLGPMEPCGVICKICTEDAVCDSKTDFNFEEEKSIDDLLATEFEVERLKYMVRGYHDKTKRLERTIKRMESKAQKRLKETDALSARYEASQVELFSDLSKLRRELLDVQSVVKRKTDEMVISEKTNKMLNDKCIDLDAELDVLKRDLASKQQRYLDCMDQLSESHSTIETLVLENRKLSSELVGTKHSVASQARAIERLQGDLALHRNTRTSETDDLQLRLQEALAELETIKTFDIPRMTADLSAAEDNAAKSTSTINSLMSEIINNEKAIGTAREAYEKEINESREQIDELHRMLEASQLMLNGFVSKSNNSQSEKSMRIGFLEGEIERFKSIVAQKDSVISNLEHQQQDRRDAVLLMKNSLDAAQVRLLEAEQVADAERDRRRSAEASLRSLHFKMKTAPLASHLKSPERDIDVIDSSAHTIDNASLISSGSSPTSPGSSVPSLLHNKGSQSDSLLGSGSSFRHDATKAFGSMSNEAASAPLSTVEGVIHKAQLYLDQRKANRAKLARSLIASKAVAGMHRSEIDVKVHLSEPDSLHGSIDDPPVNGGKTATSVPFGASAHVAGPCGSPDRKTPEKPLVVSSPPTSLSSYASNISNIGNIGSNDMMRYPSSKHGISSSNKLDTISSKESSPAKIHEPSSAGRNLNLPRLFPKFP